ncbi:MAG TPA: methyltransferase domain-containing protein [Terracidiphilus sp.]
MIRNWFDKKEGQSSGAGASGPRIPRHSGGWASLRKRLEAEAGLRIIDSGATSPTNINFLTSLGHSVFLTDLATEACTGDWQTGLDEDDKPIYNTEGYIKQTLDFAGKMYDVVLLWTALDYLPDPFVPAVVSRLYTSLNPGGQVLAFFHTRKQPEESAHCRFHITSGDTVEMQLAQPFPIQRVFTNRSIQDLFNQWSGFRQFLAKDSISEVIITR